MENDVVYLNPGSSEAVKAGCSCPVMDNYHGKGCGHTENGHPLFWVNGDCKVHGIKPVVDIGGNK
jgi:hypothetical protein